jgi:hypothetical protein
VQDDEIVNAHRYTGTLAGIPYRMISDALNNQRLSLDNSNPLREIERNGCNARRIL